MNRKTSNTAKMTQKDHINKEKHKKPSHNQNAGSSEDGRTDQDIQSEIELESLVEPEAKSDVAQNDLHLQLEEAENKSREWQDKYLRLSAEFDNYRKRTLKEKADLLKYANEDILKNVLSIIDDFERGLQVIDKSEDVVALKEGIHLIYNKFNEFIKQNGIREIEAMNQIFDIDYHEAMTKIQAPSEELKGKVVIGE
jgi:molecular chaperone GrpE